MPNLLIVESPGKIKKIRKILGAGWNVVASMGHFRTLAKDGEDNLGFDLVGDRVKMRFKATDAKAKRTIKDLQEAAKKATRVFVATDPDREGEVIGWHIFQILKHCNKNIVRISFSEITEKAIREAIANPRQLDTNLVGSGLARSCLDKAVGFKCSPLVWNLKAKSVGRVQSAVLHLVCLREREIKTFQPVKYFSIFTEYAEGFKAFFSHQGANATSKEENNQESTRIFSEAEAKELVSVAKSNSHQIAKIESKQVSKSPPPPFITSSLQQESGSKLGLSPDQTMKTAQSLYEKGLITYMRTDSVVLSEEFCEAAKNWLTEKDPQNVPKKATKFKTNKNAQEAHEAIRPSDLTRSSAKLKQEISPEEFDLYLLIWKRAIASQCAAAKIDKTLVLINSGDITWKAKGQMVNFLGYARYWNNLSADSQLPQLSEGQSLQLEKSDFERKQTSPPSRYGEPQLVALMEKLGIGRPSTYSSSIKTIKGRKYVKISKKKLAPTELGISVDTFLDSSLADLIDSKFTANMESDLDAIANGEKSWQPYLCGWNTNYLVPALAKAKENLPESEQKPKGSSIPTEYPCPVCEHNLEQYNYSKDGQEKSLLRCSNPESWKKPDHKPAVYFLTQKGSWWSKKFGTIGETDSEGTPNSKPGVLTEYPCPVCSKQLEEYSYTKDSQEKKLLRCSDAKARDKPDHKQAVFFLTKNGNFWSKKFGELGESKAPQSTGAKSKSTRKSSPIKLKTKQK